MKLIASFASAVLFSAVARGGAWPGVEYAEVRGYAFNFGGGPASIIVDGKLNATVLNKEGALLTKAQLKRLIAALTEKHPSHPVALCFNPRHAFVFYDQSGKPVASVNVCFECLAATASPEGTVQPYDLAALADLSAELKLKRAPDSGFRKRLAEMSKR